jgi:hypothetical protein
MRTRHPPAIPKVRFFDGKTYCARWGGFQAYGTSTLYDFLYAEIRSGRVSLLQIADSDHYGERGHILSNVGCVCKYDPFEG